MSQAQQFCLKWNNHTTNMLQVFENLLSTEALVDVTLACDGLSLKAHKMVLSACSPFFQSLFLENPCKHPIVIMKDMRYSDLKAIIDFMYRGEVNVSHDQLSALLKTAETLKVKGLAEVTGENRHAAGIVQQEINTPTPLNTHPLNTHPLNTPSTTPVAIPIAQRTETPPLQGKRKRGRPRKRSLSDSNRSDDEGGMSKIKERDSPDIEELSGDASMEATSDIIRSGGLPNSSNSQSQVPSHASSNNVNSFSKSHLSISSQDPQGDDDLASGDENEFEVEPSKLLEQTLTTDNVPSNSQNSTGHITLPSVSGLEISRRSMSSTDSVSQALVPVDSLGSNLQGPDSPQDIKPQILSFDDPPISPVAGTSHGSERSMMMYMDQSGVASIPGPSNYQDNSALVPHDSQPQGINLISNAIQNGTQQANKILLPMTFSPLPQLFLINSGMWEERSEIEIVESRTLRDTMPELKKEEPDIEPSVHDTSSSSCYYSIDSYTPLPEFSKQVLSHLQGKKDVTAIWGTFIDECAKYYFQRYPTIQNSSEYQSIGRKMYNKFPSIEFEGKEPWSFFCKSLSQKIRHMKWKNKRKTMGMSSSSKISRKSRDKIKYRNLKIDRRYRPSKQYKALLRELSDGWTNESISEGRINEILRDTNKGRRTWLASNPDRKIFSVIEEFPCFSEGKYVINDFLFLMNKPDTAEMMQRLESLFSAVGSMMEPPIENASFSQKMQILSFMESEVAYDSKTKINAESIVIHKKDIPEEEMMQHVKSVENAFPFLYIFSDGEELKRALVAGDKTIINSGATDLSEAIIILIATYYTFSLEYPQTFSQVLGMLQNFVVGETYEGAKSYKFATFMRKLTNNDISDED